MTVESVTTTQDLNASNPAAGDVLTEGDNHARIMKVGTMVLCWEHVATSAISGALTISTYALFGAFVAGYDYQVTIEDQYTSTNSRLDFRATTGGGVVDTAANYAESAYLGSTASGQGSSSSNHLYQGAASNGDTATETVHHEITLINPRGTTNPRHVFFTCSGGSASNTTDYTTGAGMYRTTTAIDGLYAAANNPAFTITATVKLYRRFRPT